MRGTFSKSLLPLPFQLSRHHVRKDSINEACHDCHSAQDAHACTIRFKEEWLKKQKSDADIKQQKKKTNITHYNKYLSNNK